MEQLLKYFMEETNAKLDRMGEQLDDLKTFKAEMMGSAKLTSLMISGTIGGGTMIGTLLLVYYTRKG